MRSKFNMFAMFAMIFGVLMAFGGKPDVWQCSRPDADMLFYLNTGQAERSMDPKLWERIKSDRKQANKTRVDDDDLSFELFEKDVELLANVYMVSQKPLRLAIEGGMSFARSEQSVLSNIVSMVSEMVADGGGKSTQLGTKQKPVYDFRLKYEDGDDCGLRIEKLDEGFVRFTFLYCLEMPPKHTSVAGTPPSRQQAVSSVRSSDPAIGVVLNTSVWADLFAARNKDMRVLRRLFRAMAVAESRVRVQGNLVHIDLRGVFKSPVLAERYSADLLEALPKLEQMLSGGILAGLKPGISGSAVTISAKVRLDLAWESMMKLNANISEANKDAQNATPASKNDKIIDKGK